MIISQFPRDRWTHTTRAFIHNGSVTNDPCSNRVNDCVSLMRLCLRPWSSHSARSEVKASFVSQLIALLLIRFEDADR